MDRTTYFAGNTWQESTTGERIKVESPVNHETVGYAVLGSQADIDVAVTAARDAFDNGPWPRMSYAERADWLEKLADAMERRGTDIASTVTAEIGQPIKVSHPWAAIRPLAHLRFYAEALRNRSPEEEVANSSRAGTSIVRREPLGVAALIVPWNHPLASTTLKLAPALAAGCTVVIKPSPETPLSIFNIAEAALEIGLPEGVINIVPGGRETGQALIDHPGINKISFTGSAETGRHIASVAGSRLIPATLELGGKSAGIILESADLDTVFDCLRVASFENTGQTCALLSRILVPHHMYEQVEERLVALARSFKIGDPTEESTDLGPLASKRIFDRVSGLVENARNAGATVLAGDSPLPEEGYFFAPTVIAGAAMDSEIVQEEVFGPVITIHSYDDVDDAVAKANDSRYGLAGAVFGNEAEALDVARRIETGSIGINGYRPDLNHPYGGYKDSGSGREFTPEAIYNFQEVKSIWR